jgi:hypothetical protein
MGMAAWTSLSCFGTVQRMNGETLHADAPAADGSRRVLWVALALFVVVLIPRAVFPLATSVCYDEIVAKDSGRMLDLLLTGDFRSEGWAQFPYFPYYRYLFGVIPQVLLGSDPSDPADLAGARWMGALFGSGIVVVTFLVGIRCLPFGAALLGALLLASFPTVLGHDRIASQDAPSRLIGLVGWWMLLRWEGFSQDGRRGPRSPLLPLGELLRIAACFGLCMTFYYRTGTANGLAVAIYLLVRLMQQVREDSAVGQAPRLPPSGEVSNRRSCPARPRGARDVFRILALFGVVSLGTWILSAWLFWPYMWFRPWELIRSYADPLAVAGGGGGLEFWFGTIRAVPRYYYFVVVLVCTPPLTLLAFAGWHILALRRKSPVEKPLPILLLFWVPLLVCSLTLQQMVTHYLQILMPALCLGAGAGIWCLRSWLLARFTGSPRAFGWSVVALPVLMQVYACASVSPYFFEYFNAFTGGGANVTAKRLFAQGIYGEAINPLFDYVKAKGPPGSTVLCRFGAWPGLGYLNRYLGPGFPLQGHQAIDPLGARYVLRAGSERFDMFYRYQPNPALYEKVFDVLADGGSLGDVWRRREDVAATGLLYADDFTSPQFARFAVAAQNINLNPFSDGKLYAVAAGQPAMVVQRFPASLFAGKRSVRMEIDVRMREGGIRILAGQDPRQLREVARAAGMTGTVRGTDLALTVGKDLFVALEWQTAHRWDGNPKSFWDSDWADAFRIYGK